MTPSAPPPPGVVGDDPLREGFVSGFLLIFFSEIGDKTFFIALLLALKKSRAAVFAGTFGALSVMTVISVALGQALHLMDELVPQLGENKIPYDDLVAAALLIFFGVKTIQVGPLGFRGWGLGAQGGGVLCSQVGPGVQGLAVGGSGGGASAGPSVPCEGTDPVPYAHLT